MAKGQHGLIYTPHGLRGPYSGSKRLWQTVAEGKIRILVVEDVKRLAELIAQGLLALRENAVMPRLVNMDIQDEAKEKNQSVDIPIPSAVAAQNVTAAATPPSTSDIAPTTAQVVLDQWKEAPFYLTDKDMSQALNGIIPMQASEAIKAIGNAVDSFVLGLYTAFYGYVGTAGTTPAGCSTATSSTSITRNATRPTCEPTTTAYGRRPTFKAVRFVSP